MRVGAVAKGKRTMRRIHKIGGQVRKASGSFFLQEVQDIAFCQSRAGILLSYRYR